MILHCGKICDFKKWSHICSALRSKLVSCSLSYLSIFFRLEEFHFRWLNIKGNDAALTISITPFCNPLKWNSTYCEFCEQLQHVSDSTQHHTKTESHKSETRRLKFSHSSPFDDRLNRHSYWKNNLVSVVYIVHLKMLMKMRGWSLMVNITVAGQYQGGQNFRF